MWQNGILGEVRDNNISPLLYLPARFFMGGPIADKLSLFDCSHKLTSTKALFAQNSTFSSKKIDIFGSTILYTVLI